MNDRTLEEARLLVELIRIGQEGSVRPDNGTKAGDGVCNSTGIVRDANYCKSHLENIWSLLGQDKYFGFNNTLERIR